jgi:hypothetical protein
MFNYLSVRVRDRLRNSASEQLIDTRYSIPDTRYYSLHPPIYTQYLPCYVGRQIRAKK